MVRFTKMEGLGNDYIFIDNFAERLPEEEFPVLARAVSDRHFGVGADGLIVILPPTEPGFDLRFRMFNADGSEGEMCGNGMRSFARLAFERGLVRKTRIRVQTLAGPVVPEIVLDEAGRVQGVRVDMGPPRLRSTEIPLTGPERGPVLAETVEAAGESFTFAAVSMGNPHIVIFTDADLDRIDLAHVGPALEHHPLFPQRTNVHFVRPEGPGELRMRTWERGSGITLACGTGACAALVAASLTGRSGRTADVHLPGGTLRVEWAEDGHVYQTGPANEVCRGEFTRDWRREAAARS
ncbi:diaminopimelate epimerase [Caldinitratiruptor microaerophilus]|uniref:Diaminopimelate epimerase n=1 Tax=Caldinitratiruptor microaerophilus TaxID=671077 RepID=A0AA35G832_9FIRM|nr:diaminopimelate epimerase [Caldinitratiruptor microaerophilus]BDG60666.1 diaminopimelate epimerase [Caldinitratiruptor microaerophilus]